MAVALITGTSSGIGKLTALELARHGHRVFASLRNLNSARYVRAAVEKENLSVDFVQLDVTDPRSVTMAIDYVMQREGRLDILVNNAGFGSVGPVEDYTDEEIRRLFETNLFGAIRTTRAVLPAMRAQRSGTIIMLSSISGLRTFPFMSVYSASKFALEAISNGLRYELRPFGIRVVLIEPGNFRTRAGVNMHYPERIRDGAAQGTSDPLYVRLVEKYRQVRGNLELGDATDVARLIARVTEEQSPEARYLVGRDAEAELSRTQGDFEQAIMSVLNFSDC